jgi:hypothetical protein
MLRAIAIRLRQHRLVGSRFKAADDVVRWMGAVQAQEFGPVRWGLGQRMRTSTDASIEQDFNDGRLIRTHVLRPTWHFVHPQDVRWMLRLSAPRVHVANGFSYRRDGLEPRLRLRGESVIGRALEGGRHLTRTELAAALKRARLPHVGQALAYMMMHAELEAVICSGPRRGRQFTYALLDERVSRVPGVSDDEALATLVIRYFVSHGPATLRDFTWWSGLTAAQAREGIGSAGRALTRVDIDGRICWQSPDAVPGRPRRPVVRLLPIYDEFLVALRDREWVASTRAAGVPTMAPNTFAHQLLVNGRVEGSWIPARAADGVEVRVTPWVHLDGETRAALEHEVDRYAAFHQSGPIPVVISGQMRAR